MNEIEKYLLRSRKTLVQACTDLDVDIESVNINHIEQCSSCSIWLKIEQLKEDLDKNPICKECWFVYGD